MIRVFPRRTKWTPTDDLAFIGEPPLFDLPDLPVCISVTFSWDIEKAVRLANSWLKRYKDVRIGGPAMDDPGGEFIPNRFVGHGVTITSRGCPKKCPWCYVSKREGKLRELKTIADGWIVQDNNLLACSRGHIERVFDMLSRQRIPASFPGGLDLEYLDSWHIDLLKKTRTANIFVAFDTKQSLKKLDKAKDMFSDFHIDRLRAYILIGFNGETLLEAEQRCENVYKAGFLPFAMLYDKNRNPEWKKLQRKWSRPAAYRNKVQENQR